MRKIGVFLIALLLTGSVFADNVDSGQAEKKSIMESVVSWYMDNMNYGSITLLMSIESSFIPLPSEIVVPPAVYKASQPDSDMNIVLVVFFATLGALFGSLFNYFLALWLGRPIIYKLAESKIGRMCLLNKGKIQKAEDYFTRHGKSSIFIGRLVPGVRHLISIPAGLVKMNLVSFVTYTTLGAVIWNIILAFVGYVAHGQEEIINQYSRELSYVLLALGVGFVLYLVYNYFFKKKQ
jgi:membrane protein DedA with SNARE-associated domain